MLSLYKSLPLTSEASEPTPILDLLTGSDGLEISAQEQGDGGWGSRKRQRHTERYLLLKASVESEMGDAVPWP